MATTEPQWKGVATPPAPRPVSEPTCERAGRLFALLCDLGYADALDRHRQATAPAVEVDYTKPRTSVGDVAAATPEADENAAGEPVVSFDLGEVFRQMGRHGALVELASIIFDVPTAEARTIPVAEVRDGWFPFAAACAGPLHALNDFVLDWA